MTWILLLGGAALLVFLFVSNGRMRGDVDRLQQEQRIVAGKLDQLTKLYESLTALYESLAAPPKPAEATGMAEQAPAPSSASPAPVDLPAIVTAPPSVAEPPTLAAGPTADPPLGDIPDDPGDTPAGTESAAGAPGGPPPPDAPREPSTPPPAPPPAPPRFEWERFVGVNLPVWIGAIALCIAGYFFVTYAIESGLFGPEFRVLAGVAAGLGFLAGAQFVRRRARTPNSARIAAALASAAIATFYATAYIASVTYGLIPQTFGFVAMVAVTAGAIGIALVFGQVVAVVGLIGGYVTPALFASDEPSALFLFAYLTLVHVAMFAIIRFRNWWRLSVIALAGPLLWIGLWLGAPALETQPIPAAAFLILVPLVVAAMCFESWRDDAGPLWSSGSGADAWLRRAVPLAVGVAAFGFLAFLQQSGHQIAFWQGLIVFSAVAVAASFLRSVAMGYLQLIPLAVALLSLLSWRNPGMTEIAFTTGSLALLFGFGALDQFRRLRQPAIWAFVLALIVLAFFSIGLFKIAGWQSVLGQKHLWALAALALGGALMALLWVFGPRVADERERSRVYAALAGAVTTLVSLAVVIELDPVLFPAAAALAVLGLAGVHTRVPVRGLRILATIYAIAYGLLALGAGSRVAQVGEVWGFVLAKSLEEAPFVLLILPGLAFFLAAGLFRRTPRPENAIDWPSDVLDAASVLLLALGLYYQLAPDLWTVPLTDTHVVAARVAGPEAFIAGFAIVAGLRFNRHGLYVAGLVVAGVLALAMLIALLLPVYSFWPRLNLPAIAIFDVAWLSLGVPAVLYLLTGRFIGTRDQNLRWACAVFGVFILYTLLLVEIRHFFHAGTLLQGPTSSAEFYTYSAATLLFGLVLLSVGLIFQNRRARALSLVFVLAATLKVFLFDAGALEGLWRVLSFLGMGLCFLGISWAYARYVFGMGIGRPRPPATMPPGAPA